MNITINNLPVKLPSDHMTVKDLAEWKHIPENGTAIAVNDEMVRKADWPLTKLNDLDRVTVISAAFGG